MKTGYERVKTWRKNTKTRMVLSFGGICGICGYDKCQSALEFHHIDPKKKDFDFRSICRSWDKIVDELQKCIMVCANCHREIHENIIKIPDNVIRFDKKYIDYKPKKIFNECPICGKPKSISLLTCSRECAGKKRSKIDWDKYDLKQLYDEMGSFRKISLYIGNISDISIKKRMIKEGIIER
jgi:hypothetical protein